MNLPFNTNLRVTMRYPFALVPKNLENSKLPVLKTIRILSIYLQIFLLFRKVELTLIQQDIQSVFI